MRYAPDDPVYTEDGRLRKVWDITWIVAAFFFFITLLAFLCFSTYVRGKALYEETIVYEETWRP